MSISHVKSNTIADMTGTVTVFDSQGSTATVAATNLVRPSDWNSQHSIVMGLAGNTAGSSSAGGTALSLEGGNNITLSGTGGTIVFSGPSLAGYLTTAAQSDHSHGNPTLALTNITGTTASASNGLTLSLSAADPSAGGVGLSAGTQSVNTGTVVFANSNGLSFGMSGSNQITASHNALTTARASNDAIGLNTAATSVTWTVNSGGISLDASKYLTTAAASDHTHASQSAIKAFGVSNTGQTAGNTGVSTGVDWVLAGSNSITLSQSTAGGGPNTVWVQHPAWLTTARASNDAIGLNAAATSVTWTVNSSGISLNASAYLTTQSAQAFSANASSTFQTLTFQDSNGVSFSNNAGALRITHGLQYTSATSAITANALNTSASRVINLVAATDSTGGGTASQSGNLWFSNANGISFWTSAGGAIQARHNALTTAANSTHSHGNPTLATSGAISGTTASASNGLTLSLSVPPTSSISAGGGISISTTGSTIIIMTV